MHKYELTTTNIFRKEYRKLLKRNYDMKLLDNIVELLLKGQELPEENKDHALKGNWKGYRECHIQPDWLLVYRIYENTLILSLVRTGTHSDLNF
ncbi:MAG: type II toxin-antitoxin system YafQ family toxin [Oscillospiraceae bacterium]|nr:type II toxin-antitoxin system YafQ family toxin [Oscillospiraceae bacterium]